MGRYWANSYRMETKGRRKALFCLQGSVGCSGGNGSAEDALAGGRGQLLQSVQVTVQ